jgi:hypothetical protein
MRVGREPARETGRAHIWGLALLIGSCLVGTPFSSAAQEVQLPDLETRTRALRGICMAVGDHMVAIPQRDPPRHREAGTEFQYLYEQMVFTAAGVEPGHDEGERNSRIRAMFADDIPFLHCTNTLFDVPRGHIFKYAVASYFDDFLDDLIRWGVDLNPVDERDGHTLLDYIAYHMEKSRGGALELKLKSYYDRLRAAGALHAREL